MQREIRGLTGLRGVAALAVLLYHFIQNVPVPPSALHTLALRFYLAVDVFFVLSGFVMAHTYARMFAAGRTAAGYREFLLRRVARIYPLYLVVLVLVMAQLVWTGSSVPGWDSPATAIPANLLLIQSWGLTPSLIGSSWSISTEMAAYLVFPLLLRVTLFGSRRRAIFGLAAAVLSLVLAAVGGCLWALPDNGALDLSDGTTVLPLMRCIGGFTLGLLAFRTAQAPWVMAIVERDWFAVAVFALFTLALSLDAPDLSIYPFLPFIVLIAATDRSLIPRLLASPPMHWLGVGSYAIYLLHGDVIHASRHLSRVLIESGSPSVGRVLAAAFIVLATLCLSFAVHRWIEQPGRRLLRQVLTMQFAGPALGVASRRS